MKIFMALCLFAITAFAGIEDVLSENQFNAMFPNRSSGACGADHSATTYSYSNFVAAAAMFPDFGNEGTLEERKREVAAFLGQTAHETTGGGGAWCGGVTDPNSSCFDWGYCYTEEVGCDDGTCTNYNANNSQYPAVAGHSYHGRGAMQLSWNYNYGPASEQMMGDKMFLLNNPNVVKSSVWAFRTAIWYWMDATSSRPSPHSIIIGLASGDPRSNSFGGVTNAINGGIECGVGNVGNINKQHDRVNFFKNFASDLGVSVKPANFFGTEQEYLYCTNQTNFAVQSWTGQDIPTKIIMEGSSSSSSEIILSSEVLSSSSEIIASSEVTISSSAFQNTCVDWKRDLCAWDGISWKCQNPIAGDNGQGYRCVMGLESYCNAYGPSVNLWNQWESSTSCENVSSALSSSSEITSSSSVIFSSSSEISSSSEMVSSSSIAVVSSMSQSSEVASSSVAVTACIDWESNLCTWNGISWQCEGPISGDDGQGYSCVAGLEAFCNSYGVSVNSWKQWKKVGSCGELVSSSEAFSSSVVFSSSSESSSSSLSLVNCDGISKWEERSYNWVSQREFVVFQNSLYSHKDWVDANSPDKNNSWRLEGTCPIISEGGRQSLTAIEVVSANRNKIKILFSGNLQQSIRIFNLDGAIVWSDSFYGSKGMNTITLQQELRRGIYFMVLKNEYQSEKRRFLLQ